MLPAQLVIRMQNTGYSGDASAAGFMHLTTHHSKHTHTETNTEAHINTGNKLIAYVPNAEEINQDGVCLSLRQVFGGPPGPSDCRVRGVLPRRALRGRAGLAGAGDAERGSGEPSDSGETRSPGHPFHSP